MKGKEWGILIGVVIVVTLVVSFVSVNLTGNSIFGSRSKQVTYQGVLDMLKAYDQGKCKFMNEPYGDMLNPQDDDYNQVGKPFIVADLNGDKVTTGVEWGNSLGEECLYGFRMRYLSTNENFGGQFVNIGPVGCGGGELHDDLKQNLPEHIVYLFCSAK